MGLFDVFKKKDCEICGKEVGLLGYKKLQDGEICKDCVKLLSPWFEDRRESTVAQIKEQLAYREQNAKEHENFTISRKIGDEEYIMYIEEVGGAPTRFFVTCRSDYKAENPDIISFKDVASCVTDIQVRDEEIKQRNAEGQMVSCNPRRYKHHHDFFIKMEIRNNPYFDDIKFRINGSCITLETVGDIGGGFGGAALAGLFQGVGLSTAGVQTHSYRNSSENRRYEECRMICQKIEQAVEDGKRGAQSVAQATGGDPVQMLIEQIRNAPDLATVTRLQQTVTMLIMNDPNKERLMSQISNAMADARVRIETQMAMAAFAAPAAQSAGVEPLLKMIEQIKSAPNLGIVFNLQSEIVHQATNLPEFDWIRVKSLTEAAVEDAKQRIIAQETGSAPVQEAPKPKFCPNCGAPADGGKFCQSCGGKP